MRDLLQDIRYTFRLLRRAPAFTAIAVATLALGIGSNAAIFAVVPLPFPEADRLMLVHMRVPDRDTPGTYYERVDPKYRTFAAEQQAFDDLALFAGRDLDLSGDGNPQRVRGEVVTDRYPGVLGITPIAGRPFSHEEAHTAGTPPAMLISDALRIRRFGVNVNAVGRTLRVNSTPYTIVGVLPAGFHGLNGNAEVWVPLATFEPSQLLQAQSHSYTIVGRRKDDVSEEAAAATVRVLGSRGDSAHSGKGATSATANSLYASRVDADVRRVSLVLLGAVGLVLLIACVNLMNLVAAKAMSRRREVAVRVAMARLADGSCASSWRKDFCSPVLADWADWWWRPRYWAPPPLCCLIPTCSSVPLSPPAARELRVPRV